MHGCAPFLALGAVAQRENRLRPDMKPAKPSAHQSIAHALEEVGELRRTHLRVEGLAPNTSVARILLEEQPAQGFHLTGYAH